MKSDPSIARIQCPACAAPLKIDRSLAGKRVACRCGHRFYVTTDVLHKPGQPAAANNHPSSVPPVASSSDGDDVARVEAVREAYIAMREQLSRVVIGQELVIEQALIAMLCRGHVLLTGVPGLAKTLLVSSISGVLDLNYKRVQFTPDLMPSDITGTEVLQEDRSSGRKQFQFVEGPLFCNLVLADEINRSPPKTQAALLEAMQERHVTIGDTTHVLPSPFFVMATQNPIEQEGTYPLPEAQLDRFLFNIIVEYPKPDDEFKVIKLATSDWQPQLKPVLNAEQILLLQQTVRRVPAADHVIAYARDLVQATRPHQPQTPQFIREWVGWGAGPRAGISLVMAAKARAVLNGRFHATTSDIKHVAPAVLRHRLVTTFNADAGGIKRDDIIRKLLEHVQPPQQLNGRSTNNGSTRNGTLQKMFGKES
jgi:MoxR-like ATPase